MSLRNRELLNLVAVGVLTAVGFASVYIARQSVVSTASLTYAVFFFSLYLVAHLIARATVPYGDPYLLPMAGLLTAIGVTEIYRLSPSSAFKQALWIVIGVALVTSLNILGVKLLARMNLLFIAAQVVFIAVFVAVSIAKLTGYVGVHSLSAPFAGSGFDASLVLAGAAILALSFLGFDAVSTLSEETRDPRRRIPRAILLCARRQLPACAL